MSQTTYDPDSPRTALFHRYVEKYAATRASDSALGYRPVGLVDAAETDQSWAALNEAAARVAAFLVETGVESGDTIATLFPQAPHYLWVYTAAAKLGATLVPLDLRGTPPEHQYRLEETEPVAFLGTAHYRDTDFREILGAVDAYQEIDTRYWLDEDGFLDGMPDGEAYRFTVVAEDGTTIPDTRATGHLDPDDPLLVVFTSGTTGDPKGALLTHRNVVFQGMAIHDVWEVSADDSVMIHLPADHVAGSCELLGSALVGGARMIFLDAYDPGIALSLIESERITFVGNVPAMWGMLFTHADFAETDLSSLRVAAVAGQPPTEQILGGMAQAAEYPVTGWGLTETAGFVTLTEPGDEMDVLRATEGRVYPGFEVATVADGELLPDGDEGEIVVRGDGVLERFIADAHNEDAFVDGEWVRTGDMGFLDEDGRLRLQGRKKNMFISGGYNVYPPEIENVLEDHDAVQAAIVIGVPDDKWGQVGHAFVMPVEGEAVSEAELEAFVGERLADYKQPQQYTVRQELPQTGIGKIDRNALEEELG